MAAGNGIRHVQTAAIEEEGMEVKMIAIQKVIVGCDFSEYTKEALLYAAGMAEKFQAQLIVANIINQRDVKTILSVAENQFDRIVEKDIRKLADDYVNRLTKERTQQMDRLIQELQCGHLSIKKVIRGSRS